MNAMTRLARRSAAVLLVASGVAIPQERPMPPVAERIDHVLNFHGAKLTDPYFWLREKTNPKVSAYLEAENAYTKAMTADLAPLSETLYKEMLGRLKQTDFDVPVRSDAFYYYSRTIEGKQYPLFCRRAPGKDGAYDASVTEEVLLDQNLMAEGKKYFSIRSRKVSDDGRLLAYTTDEIGFRQYSLHVKDLVTGAILPDTAERVTSLTWASDGKTLLFGTEDPVTKRSSMIWRLTLGGKPELVLEEKDELFNIGVGRTKDKVFLQIASRSTDTWETRILDAKTPGGAFKPVLPREKGHKYDVDHRDGVLFIRTNNNAKQFRLVTAPVATPEPAHWTELVPHRADTMLEGVHVFRDFVVVQEKSKALVRFRVRGFKDGEWREISFADGVYDAGPGPTPDFASTTFRLNYESPVTPPSVLEYDLVTLERRLLKQQEILGGFDASKYAASRVWAKARDGTVVPVSVVARKDVPRDGTAPLWLYGYGSYGAGMSADFDSQRISLLDRGVVYAIAHIRGGDELGETWHDDGMLMKKKNTFFDFIDVAEHLVKEKWAAKGRIGIEGGSAGGLLMGAVVNLRPDLFRAVHAAVPFVDVINTMMDASLPLTVGEYLEWGDPNEKTAFDYMMSYSPYDNLAKAAYPAILVTTSFNDSQVMYWEPAKYVAKLRTLKTDANDLVFKCKMEPAGHGGASGRYDRLKDAAFESAWMLKQLGVDK